MSNYLSEETRRKMSEAHQRRLKDPAERAKHASMTGKTHSEETKRKISESAKKVQHLRWTPEARAEAAIKTRNWLYNHPEFVKHWCENHRVTKRDPEDARREMLAYWDSPRSTEHAATVLKHAPANSYGRKRKYTALNGSIYTLRSAYELAMAYHLDRSGVKWEYEQYSFPYGEGRRYFPDFWLPDLELFIECTGYDRTKECKPEKLAAVREAGFLIVELRETQMKELPYSNYSGDEFDVMEGVAEDNFDHVSHFPKLLTRNRYYALTPHYL